MDDSFQLCHSMLPLTGYFRPWASWWKVVDWEQRASLVTHHSLAEGRLQDQNHHHHHHPTTHTFPPTRATTVAHGVAGATRSWGGSQQSSVLSCYHISRVNPTVVTTCKFCAKNFPLHLPPCGFSDVWLRLVPLAFLFSVKALIKSFWFAKSPSFMKLVGM